MKPLILAAYIRAGDACFFRIQARSAGRFLLIAIVFLLWASVSPGHAQTPSLSQQNLFDVNDELTPTLKIKVNEVDLLLTARDRHNHWVTDLSEDDVSILDNGQPPSSILEFQSRSDLPAASGINH